MTSIIACNNLKRINDFNESAEGVQIIAGAEEFARKDKAEGRPSASRTASITFFGPKPSSNYHLSLNTFYIAYVAAYNKS